jgi:PAS domain S-box-containing protein
MGNIIGVSQNIADITEQKEAEKNLHFTKFTIDRSSDPIFWITPNGSLAEFNPAACATLGYADEELSFLKMSDIDINYSEEEWLLHWEELRIKKNLNFYRTHRKKDGTLIEVEINANYIEFEGMEYNCAFVRDITERKKSEAALLASNREKDFLIKEIHHRIKNNLQLISSIVYLRLKTFKPRDIRVFLEELRQKIKSISVLHERLLQTEELDSVYIDQYLERVLRDIHVSFYRPDLMVDIKTDILPMQIKSETATYCGLIVNELLTNAIKHAFPRDGKGVVNVRLILEDDGNFRLNVSDNGIGLPAHVSPEENASFGMSLIYIFVQQLGGEFTITRNKGTDFQIRFASKTVEHEMA